MRLSGSPGEELDVHFFANMSRHARGASHSISQSKKHASQRVVLIYIGKLHTDFDHPRRGYSTPRSSTRYYCTGAVARGEIVSHLSPLEEAVGATHEHRLAYTDSERLQGADRSSTFAAGHRAAPAAAGSGTGAGGDAVGESSTQQQGTNPATLTNTTAAGSNRPPAQAPPSR